MGRVSTIAVLLYFISFVVFDYQINNYKTDTATKTDAIIVLTGAKNRINEGILLAQKKMAKKLFISGVDYKTTKKDLNIFDDDNIFLGHKATTTAENAKEVKDWITQNNIKSIRLVTSNYHMPRAMQEIKHQNKNIKIITNPTYSDNLSKKWWQSLDMFLFIFVEYNKFLYVLVRNII